MFSFFNNDDIIWIGNNTNFTDKEVLKKKHLKVLFALFQESCEASLQGLAHCYGCPVTDGAIIEALEAVVTPVTLGVIILGLVGNFLSVWVLVRTASSRLVSRESFTFTSFLPRRFCNLLIMLAYVDISYLTLKFILTLIKTFNSVYPGQNMMNLYCGFHPFLLHPLLKITQMAMIILTVILSVDRFIVVFYPYHIYRQIQIYCCVNKIRKIYQICLYIELCISM